MEKIKSEILEKIKWLETIKEVEEANTKYPGNAYICMLAGKIEGLRETLALIKREGF